jgi:hypothetical protein
MEFILCSQAQGLLTFVLFLKLLCVETEIQYTENSVVVTVHRSDTLQKLNFRVLIAPNVTD